MCSSAPLISEYSNMTSRARKPPIVAVILFHPSVVADKYGHISISVYYDTGTNAVSFCHFAKSKNMHLFQQMIITSACIVVAILFVQKRKKWP